MIASGALGFARGWVPTPSAPPRSARSPELDGPASFEGAGPLAGRLYRGKLLEGVPFPDSGCAWVPLADKWDNPVILLVGKDGRPVTAPETLHVAGILDAPESRRTRDARRRAALAPALAAYHQADRAVMEAAGFEATPPELVPLFVDHIDDKVKFLSPGDGEIYEPSIFPPHQEAQIWASPWIEGVPVQLPVPKEHEKKFGGWVTCRVNRWTRTAIITGLYFAGWGSKEAELAHYSALDELLEAIGLTLLGILQVILGVLVTVGTLGGGVAAGVALVVSGVSTIVSAWFDFAAKAAAQKRAISDTVGGQSLLVRGGVGFGSALRAFEAQKQKRAAGGAVTFLAIAAGLLVPALAR